MYFLKFLNIYILYLVIKKMDFSKKLIRLHTFDNQCIFDTNFQDEILIEEDSEIAMQSISLKRDNTDVVIDTSNDNIKFQLQNTVSFGIGGEHDIILDHGTYSKTNTADLLKQLNEKSNSELNVKASNEFGSEILYSLNDDDKLQYETKRLGFHKLDGTDSTLIGLTTTNNNERLHQLVEMRSGLIRNSYAFGDKPFVNGCGVVRTRIRKFLASPDGGSSAIGIGLTTQIEKLKDESITIDDLEFCIEAHTDHTNFYRFRNPTSAGFVDSNVTPLRYEAATVATNDFMEIQLTQGAIKLIIHQNGNITHEIHSEAHDFTKKYYAVYYMLGKSAINETVHNRINFSPFATAAFETTEFVDEDVITDLSTVPSNRGNPVTLKKLIFPAESIANYLGFNEIAFNATIANFILIAPSVFQNVVHSDNYIVEMLNISLDSYDSLGGGRKNILGVIPISEQVINNKTGVLQYEPNTLYYISIKNKFKLSLRNIKARVLTTDLSPIAAVGLSSLNILIRKQKK